MATSFLKSSSLTGCGGVTAAGAFIAGFQSGNGYGMGTDAAILFQLESMEEQAQHFIFIVIEAEEGADADIIDATLLSAVHGRQPGSSPTSGPGDAFSCMFHDDMFPEKGRKCRCRSFSDAGIHPLPAGRFRH